MIARRQSQKIAKLLRSAEIIIGKELSLKTEFKPEPQVSFGVLSPQMPQLKKLANKKFLPLFRRLDQPMNKQKWLKIPNPTTIRSPQKPRQSSNSPLGPSLQTRKLAGVHERYLRESFYQNRTSPDIRFEELELTMTPSTSYITQEYRQPYRRGNRLQDSFRRGTEEISLKIPHLPALC